MSYQYTRQELTVRSNALVGSVFPHQLSYLYDVLCRCLYYGWLDQRGEFAGPDAAVFCENVAREERLVVVD